MTVFDEAIDPIDANLGIQHINLENDVSRTSLV